MNCLQLTLEDRSGARPLTFAVTRMVNAGFVGRDQETVRRHIEELARDGVPPPESVPALFPMLRSVLTCAERIEVVETATSGEVEFVLLLDGPRIYVGIGSDHTDRRLEAADMLKSKQACHNVMARQVWDYAEIREHWDQLEMSSWARLDGDREWTPYQAGKLGDLLTADQLIELVYERMIDSRRDGLVLFSGTLPILGGTCIYASEFKFELSDSVLHRSIRASYTIERLAYLKPSAVPAVLSSEGIALAARNGAGHP
jgi:hypothetical protein